MKKLFLKVCFIFISVSAFAQQEVNNTFGQQMANTFAPLEKNRVPYGLLLDIDMEFTNNFIDNKTKFFNCFQDSS
jgi:hypothetical protein